MSSIEHDFLSHEDRQWIARCRILAVLLFLGLLAGIALYDDGDSATSTAPLQPEAAAVAAGPTIANPAP